MNISDLIHRPEKFNKNSNFHVRKNKKKRGEMGTNKHAENNQYSTKWVGSNELGSNELNTVNPHIEIVPNDQKSV